MKLVASLLVRDELGRYLEPCVGALLSFVDEIRVLDDNSSDGSAEYLAGVAGVELLRNPGRPFFEHEGRVRDCLLEWTLCGDPTHILAIDADEFVSNPGELRRRLETDPGTDVWTLIMEEVWTVDPGRIGIRQDGGWRARPVSCLYRVPAGPLGPDWHIRDRALACGREPEAVRSTSNHSRPSGSSILHFGWANVSERRGRYDRYRVADGGRYHANAHLESIMWPDARVKTTPRGWPPGLDLVRDDLLARASQPRPPLS